MSAINPVPFKRGVVRPVEALRGGWNLVKDQYWTFFGITVVGIMIGSIGPMGILMGPIMCGMDLAFLRRLRGERVTFDMLFKGFDYFKESLIAMLIQVVPFLLVLLPTYLISFAVFFTTFKPGRRGDPPDLIPFIIFFAVVWVGVMVMSVIIGAFFIFTFPLIVDQKLSGLEAVKLSVRASAANLSGTMGLMLMNMVLSFVGVLACYVGAFLVIPITYASWVVAYRQVFSPQEEPPPVPASF